jgi:hypothetical protein
MKYYDRFLLEISDTPLPGAYKNDKNPSRDFSNTPGYPPTKTTKTVSVVSVGTTVGESKNIKAPWPPRPSKLARWPIERRQRWGELANQLEDEGVPFPESERRAFDEVKAQLGRWG